MRELVVLSEATTLTLSSDRHQLGPWGLFGAGHGRPGECHLIEPDGHTEQLPSKITRRIDAGARLTSATAGAGGWGDPFQRAPEAVLRDVRDGLVSIERARKEYGVELDAATLTIDLEVTEQSRARAPLASQAVQPTSTGA